MRQHRILHLILALVVGGLHAGCGSGGTEMGTPRLASAALDGMIVEIDGDTTDRSGIAVRIAETGDRAVTGPDGRFSFATVPASGATLEFSTATGRLTSHDDAIRGSAGTPGQSHDNGHEAEDEDEDEDGNPIVRGADGEHLEVRCSLRDGKVVEFSSRSDGRVRARNRLTSGPASPFGDIDGHAKTERRIDREKLEVEADHLPVGTLVEFFLDAGAGRGFESIGTATASATGEARIEFDTNDGDTLPLGVAGLEQLEGTAVEVRLMSDGTVLLAGTIPGLPAGLPQSGDAPETGGRARSRARLLALVANAEGDVELRRRPGDSEQEFKMEAELGIAGLIIVFQIEDADNPGAWVVLATRVTGEDGDAEFELETEDGDTLPLGVADVEELVGLKVRVTQDSADGEPLLSGTIPALVSD